MNKWILLLSLIFTLPALCQEGNQTFHKKVSLKVCGIRYFKTIEGATVKWIGRDSCEEVSVPSNGQCLPSGEQMQNALSELNRYMNKQVPDYSISDINLRLERYYHFLFTFKSVQAFELQDECNKENTTTVAGGPQGH